jgi:hypothetical protein
LVSFGVGFGVGVLATAVFSHEDRGRRERNHLRDSLNDLSSTLGRLGRKLAEHLPEALTP